MPQPSSAHQALASLDSLERALSLLIPAVGSFEGGRGAGRPADAEDHERAATAFASAASALDSVLTSAAASHAADRLAALQGEEAALKSELEAKRELVEGVAAKIDGWRQRAKRALGRAEAAAAAAGDAAAAAAAAAAPAGQQA